jgi:hypothetical protein
VRELTKKLESETTARTTAQAEASRWCRMHEDECQRAKKEVL